MSERRLRPLILSLLAGLILYLLALALGDPDTALATMARLSASLWAALLGLSLVNYGLRLLRWRIYLARLGEHPPEPWHSLIYLAGFALTTTPGKAGEAVRALYLKTHDVAFARTLAALFVERLNDLAGIVLLALLALPYLGLGLWPVLVTVPVLLLLLGGLRSPWLGQLLVSLGHTRTGRLQRICLGLIRLRQDARTLLTPAPLYGGLLLGLLAWGAEGLGLYWLLLGLDIQIPLALAVGIYALAVLAGALSFIPGGLGSTEAALVLLLGTQGVGTATALAVALVCRLVTLWFAVLLGGVAMFWLEWRGHGLGHSSQQLLSR